MLYHLSYRPKLTCPIISSIVLSGAKASANLMHTRRVPDPVFDWRA